MCDRVYSNASRNAFTREMIIMINKEKIVKVDIYDENKVRLLSAKSVSFPKDFFKIKGQELVLIKARDLPYFDKNKQIIAVFEYINGTRIEYHTKVDLSTDLQLNFHVGEGEILEERRESFRVRTEIEGLCRFYERGQDAPIMFEEPLRVQFFNINLGGVFFNADFDFQQGDKINLSFLDGQLDLIGVVLRKKPAENGSSAGYSCRFLEVSPAQEEKLSRFIFECQMAERDRKRNMHSI